MIFGPELLAALAVAPLTALGWIRWRAAPALDRMQDKRTAGAADADARADAETVVAHDAPRSMLDELGALHLADGDDDDSAFHSLGSPARALLARIQLCESATQSLSLMYYTLHDDSAGRALLGAALAAARRGVQVRLLLDDLDAVKRDELLASLASQSDHFEIRMFNPLWWRRPPWIDLLARFPRTTRRMHNKCFIADAKAAIVGGRNIGDQYFDLGDDTPMLDFDLVTMGNVVPTLSEMFNDYWHSGVAIDITKLSREASSERWQHWRALLEQRYEEFVEEHQSDPTALDHLLKGELELHHGKATVLGDPPHKVVRSFANSRGWMVKDIYDTLEIATQSVLLVSPYFIPGDRAVNFLTDLVKKGIRVRVLTNSHGSNDVLAVHSGYMTYRKPLLDAGVELFELRADAMVESNPDIAGRARDTRSPALQHRIGRLRERWRGKRKQLEMGKSRICLHAKTFVIDRRYLFVGSFNLDPRSAVHNTEMGVVFDNSIEAGSVADSIEDWIEHNSYRLVLENGGAIRWIERRDDVEAEDSASVEGALSHLSLSEAQADPRYRVYEGEPGMSVGRRLLLDVLKVLPVQWLL